MNENWTHQLFSEGELADCLILRWERFIAAVNAARRDGGESKLILESHLLQIPELLPGAKIMEHGFVEQNPLLPAAVILEVATESGVISVPHPRSFVIIEIQFSGEAELFRHRPPDCPKVAPQGMLCGQCLHLRYERSGSADKDWRELYLSDCKAIFDFLDLAEVCVKGFNERVRHTLGTNNGGCGKISTGCPAARRSGAPAPVATQFLEIPGSGGMGKTSSAKVQMDTVLVAICVKSNFSF